MTVMMEARLSTGEIQGLRELVADHRLEVTFRVGPVEGDHACVQLVLPRDEDARAIELATRRRLRLLRKVARALPGEPGPDASGG